jgi:hypothetical protein
VRAFRDSLFEIVGAGHLRSGTGPEFVVVIDRFPQVGDSSVVGQYTGFNAFNILEVFWPSFCGRFVGYRASMASLGNDDGDMNITGMAINVEGTGPLDPFIVDAVPDSGAYALNYMGLFGPSLTVAPQPSRAGRVGSIRVPLPSRRR